jgi:hypothetical protein
MGRLHAIFHEVMASIAGRELLIVRLLLAGGPGGIVMPAASIIAGRRSGGRLVGGGNAADTKGSAGKHTQGEGGNETRSIMADHDVTSCAETPESPAMGLGVDDFTRRVPRCIRPNAKLCKDPSNA